MPTRDLTLKKSAFALCGTAMLIAGVWMESVYGGSVAIASLMVLGVLTLIASGEYEGRR
jgi:hypothetical protein